MSTDDDAGPCEGSARRSSPKSDRGEDDRMAVTAPDAWPARQPAARRERGQERRDGGGGDQRLIDRHHQQPLHTRMIDDVHGRDDRRDLALLGVMILHEPHADAQRLTPRARSASSSDRPTTSTSPMPPSRSVAARVRTKSPRQARPAATPSSGPSAATSRTQGWHPESAICRAFGVGHLYTFTGRCQRPFTSPVAHEWIYTPGH